MRELPCIFLRILLLLFILVVLPTTSSAQFGPSDILIVANKNNGESLDLANYYAKMRNIPKDSILPLSTSNEEHISREEFNRTILFPLKKIISGSPDFLKKRIIVLVHGVPIAIQNSGVNEKDSAVIKAEIGKYTQIFQQTYIRGIQELNKILDEASKISGSHSLAESQISENEAPNHETITTTIKTVELTHQTLSRIHNKESKVLLDSLRNLIERLFGLQGVLATLPDSKAGQSLSDKQRIDDIKKRLVSLKEAPTPNSQESLTTYFKEVTTCLGVIGAITRIPSLVDELFSEQSSASVDSDISLLWLLPGAAPLAFRVPNPLYAEDDKSADSGQQQITFPLILTARLDGPSVDVIKNLISDTISVERSGSLKGTFLVDARGLPWDQRDEYAAWDRDLTTLARSAKTGNRFDVEYDGSPELAEKTEDIALYAGWYQVRRYEDLYKFRRGAVGYHIASAEAISVRDPAEAGWVKNLLERGVVATIGAVDEPYLDSFPKPSRFFELLLSGNYQLVEVYALSTRYLSWRLILFGDPLYQPVSRESAIKDLNYSERHLKRLPERPSNRIKSAFDLMNASTSMPVSDNKPRLPEPLVK